MSYQTDVDTARAAADAWAVERGLPPSGGYSGDWFVNGYMEGWWPAGWLKWWAVYNGNPGSIIGGEIVAHQWTSTPVDRDAMLDSEIVSATPEEPDPPSGEVDQAWLDKKPLVVNTLAYIQTDLVNQFHAEANRRNGPRKTVINQIADELYRASSQALA